MKSEGLGAQLSFLPHQWRPGWVGDRVVIAIGVPGVNGFARAPEIVGVFGVHHSDRCVLDGNIEQGEQAGIFQQAVVMGGGGDARNVVADNLRVRHPEERRFGLIRCARGAVESAKAGGVLIPPGTAAGVASVVWFQSVTV